MHWNVTNQINKLPWRYALEQNQSNSQVCLVPSPAANGGLGPNHGSTRVPPQKVPNSIAKYICFSALSSTRQGPQAHQKMDVYCKIHMVLCSELNKGKPLDSFKSCVSIAFTYDSLFGAEQTKVPRLLKRSFLFFSFLFVWSVLQSASVFIGGFQAPGFQGQGGCESRSLPWNLKEGRS